MDTAWIQIFILSLTQCVAPAGDGFCEPETVELQFAEQRACESARDQILLVAAMTDSATIDAVNAQCIAKAKQLPVFARADDALSQRGGAKAPLLREEFDARPDSTALAHDDYLPACDNVAGVAPCRIGPFIVEATAEFNLPQAGSR